MMIINQILRAIEWQAFATQKRERKPGEFRPFRRQIQLLVFCCCDGSPHMGRAGRRKVPFFDNFLLLSLLCGTKTDARKEQTGYNSGCVGSAECSNGVEKQEWNFKIQGPVCRVGKRNMKALRERQLLAWLATVLPMLKERLNCLVKPNKSVPSKW